VDPPGREMPRPRFPSARDRRWIQRPEAPSIDRGQFASVGLTPRLGAPTLRAASEAKASPSCAEVVDTRTLDLKRGGSRHVRSDSSDARFALGSASASDFSGVRRVRRLGLGPRSQPVDLAIDPALMAGEEASMRPAVVAYRLLQPKQRRTSTSTSSDPRITTGTAIPFEFCATW